MRRSSFSTADQIGIVVGLDAEARLARRLSRNVRCSGGRPEVAYRQAQALLAAGARSLVSFGIAGGLADGLPAGTLLVAAGIVCDEAVYPAASDCALLIGAQVAMIYGGVTIAATIAQKKEIAKQTGALALDLESGPVARVAAAADVPFIAIRAIADPAWKALPPAALLELGIDGRPQLAAVFRSVALNPLQIPSLIATARETSAALGALRKACRLLAR